MPDDLKIRVGVDGAEKAKADLRAVAAEELKLSAAARKSITPEQAALLQKLAAGHGAAADEARKAVAAFNAEAEAQTKVTEAGKASAAAAKADALAKDKQTRTIQAMTGQTMTLKESLGALGPVGQVAGGAISMFTRGLSGATMLMGGVGLGIYALGQAFTWLSDAIRKSREQAKKEMEEFKAQTKQATEDMLSALDAARQRTRSAEQRAREGLQAEYAKRGRIMPAGEAKRLMGEAAGLQPDSTLEERARYAAAVGGAALRGRTLDEQQKRAFLPYMRVGGGAGMEAQQALGRFMGQWESDRAGLTADIAKNLPGATQAVAPEIAETPSSEADRRAGIKEAFQSAAKRLRLAGAPLSAQSLESAWRRYEGAGPPEDLASDIVKGMSGGQFERVGPSADALGPGPLPEGLANVGGHLAVNVQNVYGVQHIFERHPEALSPLFMPKGPQR